ncbi:unnamed protein product [Linum trigynum]|uniref:BAG family molecular chaperone regulator 8, chloroplastic n=1 Tax=Linum trigynum TaxID=586398 RepID=A0AAV2EWF4_9ROSI
MGSHSHHNHRHCPIPVSCTPAAYCCSGGCCNENSPYSPTGSPLDPLLVQSVTALLHQQQNYQQHQCLSPCCFPPSRVYTRKDHCQTPHSRSQTQHSGLLPQKGSTSFFISSLLQRLEALESSLHQLSSTSADKYPLRDAAARVIQSHYRAFLVHKSRTLRQLKYLASIKSAFNSLTASISGKSSFNFELVSQKAMDLLLKLDSVQGGDPMVRGGKRSMSKELVRFLELVDSSRKKTILYKSAIKARPVGCGNKSGARNVSTGCGDGSTNREEIVQKLRHRVGKINDGLSRMCKHDEEGVDFEGFQYDLIDEDDILEEEEDKKVVWKPKKSGADQHLRVKNKSVSFAEDENVHTFLANDDVEEHYTDDEVEATLLATDNQNKEAPSRHGMLLAQERKKYGTNVKASVGMHEEDGSFFVSAPVPAKMESRAHSTNASSAAKNVS